MGFFSSAIVGYFFGFGFGLGCALAVIYSIYTGAYRKAVEDSLREEKSERFLKLLPKARAKIEKERSQKEKAGLA
jgi:hypothetical protein